MTRRSITRILARSDHCEIERWTLASKKLWYEAALGERTVNENINSRYNFPHHNTTNDIWWYYMIELGFYISLMFSQFMDVKRKDFWEMFVHHIVTILLLTLSWTCNLTRIGTLVGVLILDPINV